MDPALPPLRRFLRRPLTLLLVLLGAGCQPEPDTARPPEAASSVARSDIESPPVDGRDSGGTERDRLYALFEDLIDGRADSVYAVERFDSLAAAVNAAHFHGGVSDTLDFDGDGVADRLVASSGRGGLSGSLYLSRADSLVRVGSQIHLGQEFAVCHGPDRTATIYTYSAIGVHGDVSAATLHLSAKGVQTVAAEGFSALVEGSEPIPQPERGRRVARARELHERTVGPPRECAFRCYYFECCSAGGCPDVEAPFSGEPVGSP